MTSTTATPSLRERQKAARRAAMVEAAYEVLRRDGFTEGLMEAVGAAVTMSARSVYRYFPTREDLLLAPMMEANEALVAAVRASGTELPLLETLVRAMDGAIGDLLERITEADFRVVHQLIADVASVRARTLLHSEAIRSALVDALVARPDVGPERAREAEVVVTVFHAISQLSQQRWRASAAGGPGLQEEFRATLALLPAALAPVLPV